MHLRKYFWEKWNDSLKKALWICNLDASGYANAYA